MCLSHCWGQERPLMTTTKNISSHLEEIPWSTIPATFKDAILFGRKLDIRYIWIDSLCIIQDSSTDWEIESSKMADIYRNSHITIAATAAKDSRGGLDTCHTRESSVKLRGRTASDKPYDICCQYAMAPMTSAGKDTPGRPIQHPISSIMTLEDYGGAIPVFPLLTRGWVFQERLLSPRFLQCGRDELLWDCRESMHCECGQRPPDLPYNQVSIGMSDNDLLAHKWRKIVEFYCSLNLTYDTDKLPALSGLARQMSEMKSEAAYLAGIWSDSLDLDLLWVPCGPDCSEGKEYLGPSWSWSSSGRRIIYPSVWRSQEHDPSVKVLEVYFEFINAFCTAGTADPNGRVTDGRLVMSVPLFPLIVGSASDNDESYVMRYKNTPFFQRDGSQVHMDKRPSNWRQLFDDFRRRVFLDNIAKRGQLKNKIFSCRLARLEILEDSTYYLVFDARDTIQIEFSLLLEQIDEDKNVFRRIGLLADGRVVEGHKGDAQSWMNEPSCFEKDNERTQITII